MSSSIHLRAILVLFATYGVASAAMDAADLPTLKSGLWVTSMTSEALPSVSHSLCMDEATQKRMLTMGVSMMASMCAKSEMRREGAAVVFESDCSMGPMSFKSHAVTTFNGDTAYRTESTTQFDPPMMGHASNRSVVEGRYQGSCPPEMKPGDVKMPDGRIVNIEEMQRMLGQPPR